MQLELLQASEFSKQSIKASWVVSGATPYTNTQLTTPMAEKSWKERKDDHMTTELTVVKQFQAESP